MRAASAAARPNADGGSSSSSGPSRSWLLTALALAIALAVPFFVVDVPPVLDYPNHLARYFVLAHPDDPILSQMYAPHWGILPNLGMDVIGASLLRVTSVHVGGRLILALSLFAPVIGVVAYSRVAFGRFSYRPLASGLAAYNGVFFLGLMNFQLSVGLALAGAAAWMALRRRASWPASLAVGAGAATIIFFCHIFGVMLFALLIGTAEIARLLDMEMGRPTLGEVARTGVLVALALSPAVALYVASPLSGGGAALGAWRGLPKLWALLTPFMTTSARLTSLTSVVVISFLILVRRNAIFAPGIPLALVGLALVFVATPFRIGGGTFVDARLALMMGFLLFAGLQPRISPRYGAPVGLTFAALIGLRVSYIAMTWIDHRVDLADLRSAIAEVRPGARVLVARGHPGHLTDVEQPVRALPGVYRLDGHLAALLVVERRAFWPLMFADPAQQPLEVRPPYDEIAQPLAEPVDWPELSRDAGSPQALGGARYLRDWRAHFDDVLLIDPPTPMLSPRGLLPAYAGGYAVLYRIQREAPR